MGKPAQPENPKRMKASIQELEALIDENCSVFGGREMVEPIIADATVKRKAGKELTALEARAYKLGVEIKLLDILRELAPPD